MSLPHLGDGIKIEIVLERYFLHDHISQHTADPSDRVVHLTAMKDVNLRDLFHLPDTHP